MAKYAYVIQDKKVLIFWSMKAGSTSLANWLIDVIQGPRTQSENVKRRQFERRRRRILERTVPVVGPEEALRLIREEGYTDFVMTRNPYRRVVSSFVEKFLFYEDQREPMDRWTGLKKFAQIAFLGEMARQGKPSDESDYEGNYPGMTFVELLQYILYKAKNPDETGEPKLNGHWNLQVPFSFDREGFEYSRIIRLENASVDIVPLAQMLETEVPFPHARRNENEGFTVVSDQDLSMAKSVDLIRAKTIPSSKALLAEHSRALIREAFEIDFRKLGYDPDAP